MPLKNYLRNSDLFLLAAWFGLGYGLLEAGLLLWFYAFSDLAMWNNGVAPQILWIGPLFNLILFLLVACGLAVLFHLLGTAREHWRWPIAIGLYSGLAVMGLFLSPRSLKIYGCVFIGLGAAVQMIRWARRHFVIGFFRRTLAFVLAAVVLAGAAGELLPRWREHQFLAALPPAQPGRPNVLLIVLDTLRADHVSAYGYPRVTTPNLDRIAAKGMLFERAFSPSTNSPISHIGMLSGKLVGGGEWYSAAITGRFSPLLAESLAGQGYATFAGVANYMWVTPKMGFGSGVARYKIYFHTPLDMLTRVVYGKALTQLFRRTFYYDDPSVKRAATVNRQLLQWIDDTRFTGRPFFGMLNYFDVHDPYLAPPPFRTKFSDRVTRRNMLAINVNAKPSLDQAQLLVDAYDGEVAYLDACMGELQGELERRGLFENTLIIITADHGEALGEVGRVGHVAPVLRQEVVHVPLILYYPPAVPAGVRVSTPVSGRQIPATIANILGLPLTSYDATRSLLQRGDAAEESVFIENDQNRALVSGKWHLVQMKGVPAELYDLDADPKEGNNLIGRPEVADIQARLHADLAAWVAKLPRRGKSSDPVK